MAAMIQDYSVVTEVPGLKVTDEAVRMLYTRYEFAARIARDKDVLEVACGTGQGLGMIARRARRVVGGDYTERMLHFARKLYQGRIDVIRLDAHQLPFADRTFDVILLYEAIYYLRDPHKFLEECRRVLRPGGCVVITTVNKDWSGFNPSPFSYCYFSVAELRSVLENHGYDAELFGAFPVVDGGILYHGISLLRRIAVRAKLVPKTMRGKELLKRLFYGKLKELGTEVKDGMAELEPLVAIDASPNQPTFKIFYAIGRRGLAHRN